MLNKCWEGKEKEARKCEKGEPEGNGNWTQTGHQETWHVDKIAPAQHAALRPQDKVLVIPHLPGPEEGEEESI